MASDSSNSREKAGLARRLVVALVTPILLLVAVGAVLGFQVLRMSQDSKWVDHVDEVIAKINELQLQIVDQETGLRGFYIANDPIFLEPYMNAKPLERIKELRVLLGDNWEQVSRVDELRRLYEAWVDKTTTRERHIEMTQGKTATGMRERKDDMDAIRRVIWQMMNDEANIRHVRADIAATTSRQTKLAFIILLGATAIMLAFSSRRQLTTVASTYGKALEREQTARAVLEDEEWVRAAQLELANRMQGDISLENLGDRVLQTLAKFAGFDVGAFFFDEMGRWRRGAGYALAADAGSPDTFNRGEGPLGEAANKQEITRITNAPSGFLKFRSSMVEADPVELILVPATVENSTCALLELAFLRVPSARALRLLERIGESVALAARSAEYKHRLRELLDESQRQTEELQAQQEELRVANEELAEQSNALREAHAQLEERQHELEATNARLEEQAEALRQAEREISGKAAEVEQASRYKSQFLANMSHELRTPLNSSLILAKLLADNKHGNLTDEQVRFAQTIYAAGNELLALINDVLDLSKIEAGKMELRVISLPPSRLRDGLLRTFEPMAREKGISFSIQLESDMPNAIDTDPQRLEQILKNLLSNALKFTEKGEVSLRIARSGSNATFAVRDTGIGIEPGQQAIIFEAFRQADGKSNRKYGGTGLGLSISRDLARLLGGGIQVQSEPGRGSVFTLTIPIEYQGPAANPIVSPFEEAKPQLRVSENVARTSERPPMLMKPQLPDDRNHLDRKHRLALIIEDDPSFAQILADLAHELDFQCLIAHEGDIGFSLAREHVPSAIVLDMNLPDHSGLSVLDRLKRTPATRHIPVHIVSVDDHTQAALSMGAVGYMLKPAKRDELIDAFKKLEDRLSRDVRRLLIVEDDSRQRESLIRLLGAEHVETIAVGSVREALAALSSTTFDCVVTDLTLPDASGFDLLEQMAASEAYAFPPVIVYTGRSLNPSEEQRLRKYASSIVIKGARSPERLLDEVTLFLHQVESDLPAERQKMLKQARDRESIFEDRQILIVEDDVRNIFALSSILEPKGAKVIIARNGREALEILAHAPQISLVLMDIMMPEMDGLQATREIRKQAKWAKLPIIALTAKAMKDDHERCLQAGANDYISKPLDVEMLLSLLRVWMPK